MRKRQLSPVTLARIASVLLLVPVLYIPIYAASKDDASKPPSIAKIRLALMKQNNVTIEVKYTMKPIPKEDAKVPIGYDEAIRTYIRTPEMLYLKLPFGMSEVNEERSSERKGIDDVTKVDLKMNLHDDKWRGATRTENANYYWSSSSAFRIETLLFPLDKRSDDPRTYFLYGWLRYGKVCPEMEEINGHKCWKVDITDVGDSKIKHLEVWLDPSIGYNPRFLKETGGTDESPWTRTIEFLDYQEIAKKIWFPKEIIVTANWAKGGMNDNKFSFKAVELYGDKVYTKEDLTLDFPPEKEIKVPDGEIYNPPPSNQ